MKKLALMMITILCFRCSPQINVHLKRNKYIRNGIKFSKKNNSRRELMLGLFKKAPTLLKREGEGEDEVWKGGYHVEIVETK
jgi:hypothetical protein